MVNYICNASAYNMHGRERSFITLRRVKTWTESTMDGPCTLGVHREKFHCRHEISRKSS